MHMHRCTLQCCMHYTLHCTSVHAPLDSVQSRVCVDTPNLRCACTVCTVAHCNVACTIHTTAPVSTYHYIFRSKSFVRGHTSLVMRMHLEHRCTLQCCMYHT